MLTSLLMSVRLFLLLARPWQKVLIGLAAAVAILLIISLLIGGGPGSKQQIVSYAVRGTALLVIMVATAYIATRGRR